MTGKKEEKLEKLASVVFVSGNQNKLKEVRQILSSFDVQGREIDLPELQGYPENVAVEKCKLAAQQVGGPVIVEDTSLCYNALQGLPGVYIKWFLDKLGHDGLNRILAGYEDKSAYAQCIFAFSRGPGFDPISFVGRCPGKIVAARGSPNFGWDPVFQPDGFTQTFAEMSSTTKNAISHRSKSLDKLKEYLIQNKHLLSPTTALATSAPM